MLSVEHSPLSPSQKAARPYLLGGRVGILVGKRQLSQQSLEESDHGFSSGFTGHCLTTLAEWPQLFICRLGPLFCAQKQAHWARCRQILRSIVSHSEMGFFLLVSCQQLSHLELILSSPHRPCFSLGTWHLPGRLLQLPESSPASGGQVT